MQTECHDALFPRFLQRPATVTCVTVLPALLLTLVNSFCFWLVWGEMRIPSQHACAAALLATSVLPALAGAAATLLARRRPDAALPAWVHPVLGAFCLAHLAAFLWLIRRALPSDTPEWVLGPSFFLIQFACMVPGLFTGVWRIAGSRLNLRPLPDVMFTLLATFVPPVLMYVFLMATGALFRHGPSLAWRQHIVMPILLVILPVIFFLGLLRLLMLARRLLLRRAGTSRAFNFGYVGTVALILPIAGLLLNRKIPFPADFQNAWPYALTVLNAGFLLLPAATGRRWLDILGRVMRRVLFPFTGYFFVVFLPFLPFAILAIVAMGLGFLVLAPTLLFMVHGQILARDFALEAAVAGRRRAWFRTVVCLLVLPLAFAARTEFDRFALHRTLNFRYAPDYAEDARLSVPPALVRHILLQVRQFKDGAELPYLTNWYNWRVFDNLLLPDEKAADLWRLIVGGEPPAPEKGGLWRNAFASLFGGRTRDPGRWGNVRSIPHNVALGEVQTTHTTANGETETRVLLKITSRDTAGQAQYQAAITVPPGVWVSGLRLKIDGRWETGRVIERKAAEWVYRQIRDVSRRDPAILRYEGDNRLTLRVFPVSPGETREVELSFLCPDSLADAVMIGERRVPLGDGTLKPVGAWAAGVFARSRNWQPPETADVETQPTGRLILDCSAGAAWTDEALAATLRRAREVLGVPMATVTLANYETRTLPLGNGAPAESVRQLRRQMLPARGTFDAAGALLRLGRQLQAAQAGTGPGPLPAARIAIAGHSVVSAVSAVKPETWDAWRHEAPTVTTLTLLGTGGTAATFAIPGAEEPAPTLLLRSGGEVRTAAGTGTATVVFAQPAADLRIWNRRAGAFTPVPGLTVMPPESRWAKGAAAWRLQRELEEHPARESLRRDILAASRGSGVLTPAGSYIVVENRMQWKMLEVKQHQALAGDAALDLVESPAPRAWVLALLGLFALWIVKAIRRGRGPACAGRQ